VLGDLHEEYVRFAVAERGSTRARLWYWTQVLALLRDRVLAGFAVLTLAVGVGSGATMFVFVNGALLRSLPPHRLDVVAGSRVVAGDIAALAAEYRDNLGRATSIDGLAGTRPPGPRPGSAQATEAALRKCPRLLSYYLPFASEGRELGRLPLPRDLRSLETLGDYLRDGMGAEYVRRTCLKLS
jgi:hypothetical protein